ncbi:HEPN domain-containing protein [Delftia sp. WSY_9]|uniref:ApeA N-terminal domain 1-containing protein n=1 Tax=unclassified Delftia TaxID=2613839 RepID=UPI00370A3E33
MRCAEAAGNNDCGVVAQAKMCRDLKFIDDYQLNTIVKRGVKMDANFEKFLGKFCVNGKENILGELSLNYENTHLNIYSDNVINPRAVDSVIYGETVNGEKISLVDCVCMNMGSRHNGSGRSGWFATFYPHYSIIGTDYINPSVNCLERIDIASTDINEIFNDFDAFGYASEPEKKIESLLDGVRQHRHVESGEFPIIVYFTGRKDIIDFNSSIGRITVQHRPAGGVKGVSGFSINNRVVLSIEFERLHNFEEALGAAHLVRSFLSVVAGRRQTIETLHIYKKVESEQYASPLKVISGFSKDFKNSEEDSKPNFREMPLDSINGKVEFENVFEQWLLRSEDWGLPRNRYLNCMGGGNVYGADRIIAAANMFDILPDSAVPKPTEIPNNVSEASKSCQLIFANLPDSIEKNSILGALGRLGKPSLPKKVKYRVGIVMSRLGPAFPELEFVGKIAVNCRNYFVHGGASASAAQVFDSQMPFLTETLEFVFVASDLIECGWSPNEWHRKGRGLGHKFSRYAMAYEQNLAELKKALKAVKKV